MDLCGRVHRLRLRLRVHGGNGLDVRVAGDFFWPIAPVNQRRCRAPTSGGQYHWVSEFAPREYQKFLSYITGTART